ncbi:MAG: hypothetical protein MJ134_06820 [Lachnospiraceae bacterium]|nr:hypothetical protein [Lachnospiraceae bacterium]
MKKRGFKEHFRYWFDNIMSKGTGAMLAALAIAVLGLTLIISLIIFLGGLGEGSLGYTFWDVLSTTINAWMPSSGDGDAAYVVLVAISAIVGVLVTSILIGIISSAVEDKVTEMRRGNSLVLENGHIVILGFKLGEYILLDQLVKYFGNDKACIVVAESMEREEMESAIKDNLDIPSNMRIICRNINITDPVALECCSIETASLVIVNPIEDKQTVRTLMAVASVLDGVEGERARAVGAVELSDYIIPTHICRQYGITLLHTDDMLARIIAHSCTQPGLPAAFSEIFSFEGSEIYIEDTDVKSGSSFKDILYTMKEGVPLGIYRDDATILNPDRNMELLEGDKVILLEKSKGAFQIAEKDYIGHHDDIKVNVPEYKEQDKKVLIIGSNRKLRIIMQELPSNVTDIFLVKSSEKGYEDMCRKLRPNTNIIVYEEDLFEEPELLLKLTEGVDHVIVLNNYHLDEEISDTRNMLTIFKLREIRSKKGSSFTITSEMRREDSRSLILGDDLVDFVISTDMSDMVLAQVALNPKLQDTFNELLSNDGSEFLLRDADFAENCIGISRTVAWFRRILIHKGCILLGYISNESGHSETFINPALSEEITLKPNDKLIVIGRKN